MVKFIPNAYKELYAWFLYNTNSRLLSISLSYLILVVLQLINVLSFVIIFQKILGIQLLEYILLWKAYIAAFVAVVFVVNYLLLSRIWKRDEDVKDVNHRAFAYILISLLIGAIALVCRH